MMIIKLLLSKLNIFYSQIEIWISLFYMEIFLSKKIILLINYWRFT